jgi:hypothetical protein
MKWLAALLFALSTVILVVVSYATAPPTAEHTADLTYKTAKPSTAAAIDRGHRRASIALSVVLAALIGVLWIIFR